MSLKQRRMNTLQHFLPQSRFVKSASICEKNPHQTTITITYKTVLVKGGGEKNAAELGKLCPPRPKLEATAVKTGRPDKKSYSTALLNSQTTDTETERSAKRSEDIPRVSVSGVGRQLVVDQNLFPFMQAGRIEISPEVFKKLKMESALHLQDCRDQRFSVLSYEQVTRLSDLMNEVVAIHGRGNFPTLEVKLVDLVVLVRTKLEADGVPVKEIRLNGSGASSVLASNCNISYNDLDLIFTVDLPTQKHYERVKQAVLDSLLDLLPEGTSKKRMSSCTLKEAYVSKMVKVNDSDRWSLIALGNNRAKSVELKFVDRMKRKYEFSVDSFHIMLDTLFLFYSCAKMPISDNFYPTVVGESVYGNFEEALLHLHKKLIATKHPEEIRGGGLLKYCNLLVKNYRPAQPEQVKSMEKYMCSRFFIDFPDLSQQHNKLVKFLDNHFQGSGEQLMYDYLMILYQVVDESTVCLMGHERRQTLALIEDLSCSVYATYEDNNSSSSSSSGYQTPSSSWDTASTCSSSSSSCSSTSSEQYSPLSTTTSSPSLSPKPAEVNEHQSHHNHHHHQQQQQQHHQHQHHQQHYALPHNFSVPPPQIIQHQLHQQQHSHHSSSNTAATTMGQPPPAVQQQQQQLVAVQQQPPQQHRHHHHHHQQQQQHQVVQQQHHHPVKQQQAYPSEYTQTIAIQKVDGGQAAGQIPTYEIITSCQPRVVYSNGYYITSFSPPSTATTAVAAAETATTADIMPCYTLTTTAPAGVVTTPAVVTPPSSAGAAAAPPPLLYSLQAAPCFSCSCISSGGAAAAAAAAPTAQWTITKATTMSHMSPATPVVDPTPASS